VLFRSRQLATQAEEKHADVIPWQYTMYYVIMDFLTTFLCQIY